MSGVCGCAIVPLGFVWFNIAAALPCARRWVLCGVDDIRFDDPDLDQLPVDC